jgi:hypothetical protein
VNPYVPIWFMIAIRSHDNRAARLRSRFAPAEDLPSEAARLAAEVYPDGLNLGENLPDDERPSLEQARAEAFSFIFHELSFDECHIWGLAIAGLFHQWERHTREVLRELKAPALRSGATFDEICDAITGAGFKIRLSAPYHGLETSQLITNTIKHGHGRAFVKLAAWRPDLFIGPDGMYRGEPRPELLYLDQAEFDRADAAIAAAWKEFERTIAVTRMAPIRRLPAQGRR